jgi:hypothetical protein
VNCGDCPAVICKTVQCSDHECAYTNVPDGQTSTGCSTNGKKCCKGQCCTSGQICTGAGCCTPDSHVCDGKCGTVTNNCGQQINCGTCPAVTCKDAACEENICKYTNKADGSSCGSGKKCCNGTCCTSSSQVCYEHACCTPNSTSTTCNGKCGTVVNNCGQSVDCGSCPSETCKDASCQTNICVYTNKADGTSCGSGKKCCAGVCCNSNQSCVHGVCKDKCGSNPPCGDGQTCCGGTCETGICCELNEGCSSDSQCCDGLDCIDPKDSGSPTTCQKCCQAAKDCRDFFESDDWVCVGDPKICDVTGCRKCCKPKQACSSNNQCDSGEICCDGFCAFGTCCAASDCPDQTCKSKTCTENQCVYTNQTNNQQGTNCSRNCCNGVCCSTGKSCQGGQCRS